MFSIVTRLLAGELRNLGLLSSMVKRLFSSPQSSDKLWDTTSLLFNGYWGCRVVKLTTHL